MTVKSKATMGRVLEAYFSGGSVEQGLAAAFEAAGVELAPELTDFWGERLKVDKHGHIYKPGPITIETQGTDPEPRRNRAALALSHSLRVAAAELMEKETREDGSLRVDAGTFVRRLRRILLDNEPFDAVAEAARLRRALSGVLGAADKDLRRLEGTPEAYPPPPQGGGLGGGAMSGLCRQGIHAKLATSHPSLARGRVWCRTCGRSERVDPAECLRSGWPKCCVAVTQ